MAQLGTVNRIRQSLRALGIHPMEPDPSLALERGEAAVRVPSTMADEVA